MVHLHSSLDLSSHPEAYSRSFQCFLASTHQENNILKCIKEHIAPSIGKEMSDLVEGHSSAGSPFRVLGVGSGEGENDVHLLEAFSKIRRKKGEAIPMVNRVIEPDKEMLSTFRGKVASLPKESPLAEFEWVPKTFEEYTYQKNTGDVKFDVVHFIHSIYYLDVKEALVHCFEKELGEKGIIISIAQDAGNPMRVLAHHPNLGQHVVAQPRNSEAIAVAIDQGWRYFTCPGDSKTLDITSMFDSSSSEGGHLDFLTHVKDIRENKEKEVVENILNLWKEQSFVDEHGKRLVELVDNAVIIVKGFSNIF